MKISNNILESDSYNYKYTKELKISKINPFINPQTGSVLLLSESGDSLYDSTTKNKVAIIENGIPRFVNPSENYAESFGWQWKKWAHNQSESRGSSMQQHELIMERTKFENYILADKIILECGMGGGDDTEVLLSLPFKEIHSFDLSTAVERAALYLDDPRLFISQASIYNIPYPDKSFDFVFCHRVLQHTPDPENSLRCICRKVKLNGILFIHSYKRSKEYMSEWRYKYRWLTTRLPKKMIYYYVQYFGSTMHYLILFLNKFGKIGANIAYKYVPFYKFNISGLYLKFTKKEAIEFEKMITFDALTPKYDSPMATSELLRILDEEGFVIDHINDSWSSPVYATARKIK